MRNYERLLADYVVDLDNVDLIDEAIASLEASFNNRPEWEVATYSRVDAVAYLALKGVQARRERPIYAVKPIDVEEVEDVLMSLQYVKDYATGENREAIARYASRAMDIILRMKTVLNNRL